MIKPHGADKLTSLYISSDSDRAKAIEEAASLPSMLMSSGAAGNAVMMGAGYFTPLKGFMNKADAMSVADSMHTADGLFWPTPVLNLTQDAGDIAAGNKIALRDPNVDGHPVLAIMQVEAIETFTQDELNHIAEKVYRTTDAEHPGVAAFLAEGAVAVSGPIEVLNFSYFETDFPDTFRTADAIRADIEKRGWKKVIAFQTRNPMHRAHEELCHMAMDQLKADGIVVHMLLGKLKPGDIPADVRDAAIRKMADVYFPPNTVSVTGYGFDMLYAGPREAVLHALFRQNMGATHLIVVRRIRCPDNFPRRRSQRRA